MKIKYRKFLSLLPIVMTSTIITSNISATQPLTETQLAQCLSTGLSQCPQPYEQDIPDPANMLTWPRSERAVGLRNTYKMYEGDIFKSSNKPSLLTKTDYPLPFIEYQKNGEKYTLNDYINSQNITGLLILKNGQIAFEYYGEGNTESTLWTSRSVAKSIVTILLGIAVQNGQISSIHDPLIKYLPELKDSHWETITIEELMQHTTGVSWNEDYSDPHSDFSQMTICEAGPVPFQCVFDLIKSRPKVAEPGEVWSYSTGGAWLVGVLLERVTGKTIAQYLENQIWKPYGMEQEGVWQALIKDKVSMGGHGFHANLRDWGRFGLFVQNNGTLPNGKVILPKDWIRKSTEWNQAKGSVTTSMPNGQYGYQWWFKAVEASDGFEPKTTSTSDNTFWALGIYGQSIAINQKENLVIVQWSAQESAYPPQILQDELVVFFNATAEALKNK